MNELQLVDIDDSSQNDILQIVRMRFEDPAVHRVGHLRIPKKVVTTAKFQEELEKYVPSLVLFSRWVVGLKNYI